MFKFNAEDNLVLKYQVQMGHQDTLIFHLLLPSLESQLSDFNEPLAKEIENTMQNWGKTELFNYSYISTYHLWEKQISHIIRNQSKETVRVPNRDFVKSVKKILLKEFQIDDIDSSIWEGLEKARTLVNAFKHGFGRSYDIAKNMYPELFWNDEYNEGFPNLILSEKEVKELLHNLERFYERLNIQTELDFSNW